MSSALQTARHEGYLNTVVTTAPQVTSYLMEHLCLVPSDAYTKRLTRAALAARATQPGSAESRHELIAPLTKSELRVLKLLPTSSYMQIASTLYISHNTVKTHVRAVYQKLGVVSRSEAVRRAIDLGLL